MLKLFEGVKDFVKSRNRPSTDSIIVKLCYKWTALLLLIFSVLVGAKQYLGDPINCFHGRDTSKLPEKVVNQYCFIKTTFTIPEKFNDDCSYAQSWAHPGVKSPSADDEPATYHAYYQWVPLVLLLQSLSFMVPHFFWKNCEGGLIYKLLSSKTDIDLQKEIEEERKAVEKERKEREKAAEEQKAVKPEAKKSPFKPRMRLIAEYFMGTVRTHQFLAFGWYACDYLALVITLFNFYITNIFLGRNFSEYGLEVYKSFLGDPVQPGCFTPVDRVFPKVTKCSFFKYGPSGQIENIDAMCVLALNILNEKIYTILWFWFYFVIFSTIIGIVLKLAFYVLLWACASKTDIPFVPKLAFKCLGAPSCSSSSSLRFLPKNLHISDYIFFILLSRNMTPFMYQQFVHFLTNEKKHMDGVSFFEK